MIINVINLIFIRFHLIIFFLDKSNHPVLLFCTTGKAKTSCSVGCLRKLHDWSLVSIFHEFEQYCDGEGGVADLLFIENFKYENNDKSSPNDTRNMLCTENSITIT
jgi:protein tyrosine/serine phosphatase